MSNEEITNGLNTLLADYMVYYQKLRNYHWNVKGHEFFKLHEQFEQAYLQSAEWADDLAERVLALGDRPLSTLNDHVSHARLDEDPETPNAEQMVRNLVEDIQTLNSHARDLAEQAEEHHDRTTTNLLDDIIDMQEERLWMFKTFLSE